MNDGDDGDDWCLCVPVCVMDSIFAEMKDTKIQEGRT